ncbi:MAG TPA: cytochrome c oxidase subunit 3 [Actinomycetes bacterium]|jgi:cytochrome c oxidase subunit 3|nr:cytochrome c oxidase subunit 3 [Actinomycetes bacterium]
MSSASVPLPSSEERVAATTSNSVLGMVLFVASESMFFAAFFGAYVTTYVNQEVWPPANTPAPPLGLASAAAAALLVSGLLLQGAVRAGRRGLPRRVDLWLMLTLAAAVASVLLTLFSYSEVGFGLHAGIFASLFYLMTGLGLAHVAGGVVLLALVGLQSLTGRLALVRYQPVQAAAVYWNFVVVLGLVIYVAFYVLTNTGG